MTILPRFIERRQNTVTHLRPTGNQAPLLVFENPHEERGIGSLLK